MGDTQSFSVARTFNIKAPEKLKIEGRAQPNELCPEVDANYVFRPEVLSTVLAWLSAGTEDGLYLTGPTGAGKTSLIRQICARINRALIHVGAHEHMEMADLVGHYVAVDGDLIFQDGPLTMAMRGGHLFMIDEYDLLSPATAAGLNPILDGAPLVIAENGGEVVKPEPGFRFIATGNTAGAGDDTGIYQGTERQNAAMMDRFWVEQVDYPDKTVEVGLLRRIHGISDAIGTRLVEVANEIRRAYLEGGELTLDLPFSTRSLLRWAYVTKLLSGRVDTQKTKPIIRAMDTSYANRLEPSARQAVHDIIERHLGVGAGQG